MEVGAPLTIYRTPLFPCVPFINSNFSAKTQAITLLLQTNGGEQVGKVEINTSNDECCGSNEWEVSGPTVGQLRLTWKSSVGPF